MGGLCISQEATQDNFHLPFVSLSEQGTDMEQLSMRKVREVLRLKFELDLSERWISKSILVSRPFISDYLRCFVASGFVLVAAQLNKFRRRKVQDQMDRIVSDFARV